MSVALACLVACLGASVGVVSAAGAAEDDPPTEVKISPPGEDELDDGTCIKYPFDIEIIAEKDGGEIFSGGDATHGTAMYATCHAEKVLASCHSQFAGGGLVKTSALVGKLGYIDREKAEVGIEYRPVGEGQPFARFKCGEDQVALRGAIVGRVTPVDQPVSRGGHLSVLFEAEGAKQTLRKLEGGSTAVLEASVNGGPYGEIGYHNSGEIVPVGPVEVSTKGETPEIIAGAPETGPEFTTKGAVGAVNEPVAVTGTLGATVLESRNANKLTCTGGSLSGFVTASTRMQGVVSTFTGCETGGLKCSSAGQAEGVLVTHTLEGVLGGVASTLPGVRIFPEGAGRGGELLAATCAGGAVALSIKGSVIGTLSGASGASPEENKLVSAIKLTFSQTKGVQKYTKFLVGESGSEQLEASLNGSSYEAVGEAAIATLTTTPVKGNLGITK